MSSWESVRQGIASAVRSCGGDLYQVKRIHDTIPRIHVEQDPFLANHLIEAYGKSGSLELALGVLNRLRTPNLFTWNALVSAYAQNGHPGEAKYILRKMPRLHVRPCSVVIQALGKEHLEEAREVFDTMPHPDRVSWNVLIAAYAQKGHLQEARSLFEAMEGRDVVTWTTLMRGHAIRGESREATDIFSRMPATNAVSWNTLIVVFAERGELEESSLLFTRMPDPTAVTCTAMVNAYSQNGRINEARALFEALPRRDTVSWTSMLQAYASHGDLSEVKATFDRMPNRDVVSWTTLLGAYSQTGRLEKARTVFERTPNWDLVTENSMLAAYAHNGHVEDAVLLFQSLHECDLVSWTSLIAGHAQNGYCEYAIHLFHQMLLEGVSPDGILFVSILTACSHVGLASQLFGSMVSDHCINPIPEHYSCMIDILGRTGKLKDAEELAETMPYLPNDLVLGSLLAACKNQRDVERGIRVATRSDCSTYALLTSLKQTDGISSIRIDGELYKFSADDNEIENEMEITMTMERINSLLKKEGYLSVTYEKEKLVSEHSEKLALALGVVRTRPGTPLRIIKNLRVCSDCHSFIKMVSRVLGRHIAVRDASRFHYFREGKCSCKDYW